MDELISIVVPVYNVEKYLNRCIDSIINQTYSNIEIILVNDGSKDNSGNICDSYAAKDERIKVIHKENGGLSDARNVGIENSTGEYMCFIDSDDFISDKMIEKMREKIMNTHSDIVICNRIHFYNEREQHIKYKIIEGNLIMNAEEAIKELNSFRYFDMSACSKLYKSSLFEKLKFPKGKLSEDAYIMYLLFDNSNKITYFSDPLYYYYQRQNSISKDSKINYDFIEAAEKQMFFIERKYPALKKYVRSAYASANMTVYNIVIKNKGKCSKKEINLLKENVKKNYKFVLESENWSFSKKVQAFLFINSIVLYKLVFKLYRIKYKYN